MRRCPSLLCFCAGLWVLLVCLSFPVCAEEIADGLQYEGPYKLKGPKNLFMDYPSENEDGTVTVVVEIPTGTLEKWQVVKPDGYLEWEFQKGQPRIVSYLGYPGNYGMIPQTVLDKEFGGDGDPLDVIVLGQAVPRGSVIKVRILGVLMLTDGGEVDDKIIAVLESSPMASCKTLQELDKKFPGALSIVQTWFENYKGPGKLQSNGYKKRKEALKVIRQAHAAFKKKYATP
ncbi:MAG: inorganic diphosphatase [Bdellovibrionales bacterium]